MILGNGIDIVEISRIQKAIERWGEAFLNHVYTPQEIEYARRYKFPYPVFAGRFAAKEALFKAMGIPHLSWQDVSILNDAHGKPICHYKDPDYKNRILISISHGRDYAVANAIVEG